jgi:methylmalonyl-CoA epimerase
MLDRLSHVSIVVPDLEAAAARLAATYGMVAGEILVNQEQGVRITYVTLANAKIELMQPLALETPLGKFLQRTPGGGLHHISESWSNSKRSLLRIPMSRCRYQRQSHSFKAQPSNKDKETPHHET